MDIIIPKLQYFKGSRESKYQIEITGLLIPVRILEMLEGGKNERKQIKFMGNTNQRKLHEEHKI